MASKPVIPKEQLSAYQRWELSSLEDHPQNLSVPLPTAEEVERIHQQAYQEGFAAGMRDGRAQGDAFSLHQRELLIELERAMEQFEGVMAEQILALAVEISRQMVRQTIKHDPKVILAVVREALEMLPLSAQGLVLALHPEDAGLVQQMLAELNERSGWRIVEDAHIERGGCRIESSTSEIDATVESRWKRIVAALGSDASWRD